MNIRYRICGRKKSYQHISDKMKYFTQSVPERVNIEGNTVVYNKNHLEFEKFNYIQLYVLNESFDGVLQNNNKKDSKIMIDW